jgi:YYY domain-containing protein
MLAVVPYFVGYQSQPLGLAFVRDRTPLASMLIIFGPAMLIAGLYAVWLATRPRPSGALNSSVAGRVLMGLGVLVLGVTAVGQPTMAILLALLVGLAAAGWWTLLGPGAPRNAAPGVVFCWLLATWALVIVVGVEVIYLRDVFGTRMNTVFKFQYQVWLLLGLAGASALGLIWTRPARLRPWRAIVAVVTAVAILPGLLYPLGATWTKSNGFRGEPTLAGDRFLQRGAAADHQAIEWLRMSTTGRPIVVEAVGGDYTEHGRVSTFSGLPTLMGWVGHELQWRGDRPELRIRPEAVDAVYRASTPEEVARLASTYRFQYVFFGTLERAKYGADAQARLDRLMPVAYSRNGTTIYNAAPTNAAGRTP